MKYKTDVEEDDSIRTAINKIANARRSGDVVILIGDCKVNYDGRAWSYTEGRHSVIINPSGSVVVHHSDSVKAKNWQPNDAETTIELNEDSEIIVRSTRGNPDEMLEVRFTNLIKSAHYSPAGKEINLKGSEKEIHKYIYQNPEVIDADFIPSEMEKDIKTGAIDIFGSIDDVPTVVEVKRKKAQQEDVGQLRRYVETFDSCVGYLVAPDITDPARDVLEDEYGFRFVELRPSVVLDKSE